MENINIAEETKAAAEEIVKNGSSDAKIVAGIVLGVTAVVAGGIAIYNKFGKPRVEARKAKKNGVTITQGVEAELEADNVEIN